MKEKILEIIKNKPKHYSKIIKNHNEMNKWVVEHSLIQSNKYAEMIYSAIYSVDNLCEFGKIKKFESVSTGFIGCGPASTCKCTAQKVSESVKHSKQFVTDIQQEITNNKRRVTNLQKYGVTCVAQTSENRQKFKDFYADPEKVEQLLQQIKETYRAKYGVDHCRQIPESEEKRLATILAKYNVSNISQIPTTKAKLQARMAEYKISGHLVKKGYHRFLKYINDNYNFTVLTPQTEYKGQSEFQILDFQCNTCKHTISKKFYYGLGLNCQQCNPVASTFVSGEEHEIFDFITTELGIAGHQSDRTIIKPYELDMVFPDKKIAIEYCGLYWHSEASSGKRKDYHSKKLELTNQQGYRLITIFSDEWKNKQSIVKSKLRNIFGKTPIKHYARKLHVELVDQKTSKIFLNQHHLQGHSTAKINLGLYTSDNILVSLMSFSNGRVALNSLSDNSKFELVRFVTNGDSIVGGASKLLSYFIKEFKPKTLVSYADLRWSEGNVYEILGFEVNTAPTIGYWYVSNYEKREHRFNFTKKTLIKEGGDPNKTEWEIMQELGYDRIWDCGHQKYVLNFK